MTAAERQWAAPAVGRLGLSFYEVWDNHPNDALRALLEVIQHMSDFSILVENYIQGRFVPRPPAVLTDQRNFVQHSLMSLPSSRELETEVSTVIDPQYESCRLACIAYSFLVILPIPPIAGLFERVTGKLQMSILRMRIRWQDLGLPRIKLHVWILAMGAIISTGLPERSWYLKELPPLFARLGIENYGSLERVLLGFLWHSKTNGRDGIDLCRDVTQLP